MSPAEDPIAFLFGLERLGMKFGLENISKLCDALGHPERRFASVIVAGTNGKGSVTAMVHRALRAAGPRAARYTSPHLERLEERFVVDDREVTREELLAAAGRVQAAVRRLVADGALEGPPTFFECTTATAFELFAAANTEVAVLEVGLGGRLDATNVVQPVAAAITSIDFDHQALLGNTIDAIAREKAGVIKPGIGVVCGPLPEAADRVIADTCDRLGARLVRAAERVRWHARVDAWGTRIDLRTDRHHFDDLTLALRGLHQADNAAVAVALLEELSDLGFAAGRDSIRLGLTQTDWPARLERRQFREADLLIDAAHNPAGARALADYLSAIGWTQVTLLFGAMQDKDVDGMLTPLLPFVARAICTTAPTPRAMPAADLAGIVRRLRPGAAVEAIADPARALGEACAAPGRVVAAGSIFLIGPLRGILGPR